jgi:hypothetical protein
LEVAVAAGRSQTKTFLTVAVVLGGTALLIGLVLYFTPSGLIGDTFSSAEKLGDVGMDLAAERKVEGSLRASGGALGDFRIALSGCRGGEGEGFHGVDLFTEGEARPRLRFFKDPARGFVLVVTIPDTDRGLVFDSDDCRLLEGEIKRHGFSGQRTSTTWAFDGRLHFDCRYADGSGRVQGELSFQMCL